MMPSPQSHRTRVIPTVLRRPPINRTVTAGSPTGAELGLEYTDHALSRMSSLGFSTRDVLAAVTAPLWTRPNCPGHPADRTVCVGADLLVVWQPVGRTVITVLLRAGILLRASEDPSVGSQLEVWTRRSAFLYRRGI